jgi:hypothetical protein
MADIESSTEVGTPPHSILQLTEAHVAKIAADAYRLTLWLGRPLEDGDTWEDPGQFADSIAEAFTALLAHNVEQRGHLMRRKGYGSGPAGALLEVPRGWRPSYAPLGPERSVGRGRSAPAKRGAN